MAIAVEGTSSVTYNDNINRQANPISLSAPAELDVGHYYVVLVHFGSIGGGGSVNGPSGFTRLTDYGSATNRVLVAYGRAIEDAGDLSDVATVAASYSASTTTRAGAIGVALSGVDLTAPFTEDSAWVATTSTSSGQTFATAPSGDVVLNFFLNTRASATTHTLTTSVGGGSLVLQKWSFNGSPGTFNEGTGVSSSAQSSTGFGVLLGGTGCAYSPSSANGSTISIGLTEAAAPTPNQARVAKIELSTTVNAVVPNTARVTAVNLSVTSETIDPAVARVSRINLITSNLQPPTVSAPLSASPGQGLTWVATLPGATEWEWEQVAGPDMSLQNTTMATLIGTAPYPETETAVTVRVRGLSGGVWSGWREATTVVSRHELFRRDSETGDLRPLVNASAVVAPPDPEPTEGFPWLIPYEDLHASPKRLFFHYYPVFPITHSNEAPYASGSYQGDYYTRNFLPVNGEGGAHASYGGLLRDRPMPTGVPFSGDYMTGQQRVELQKCLEVGGDGFFCNIMSASDSAHWSRMNTLANVAAAEFPDLSVIPMVDSNGSFSNQSNSVIVNALDGFYDRGAGYQLPDNRFLLGTFRAEGETLSYWQTLLTTMQSSHGRDLAFLGVYNSIGQASAYAAVPQYAAGRWAPGADPGNVAAAANDAATTRARGEEPLWPVWHNDVRPRPDYGQMFYESLNTGSLRAHWERAISDNVPLIQVGTWNDYTEGSQFQPSVMRGQVALDISTYYLIRWKLGYYPTIRQDALYLSHRNQMANATITGGQTQFMTKRPGGSAFREHVEVVSFLKADATISLKIGSNTHTYSAPAGMHVRSFQAVPGEVSVKAVRFDVEIARINSPVVIKSTTENQDRQYASFGSIRGTAGQFDPTPGSPAPNPANYIA